MLDLLKKKSELVNLEQLNELIGKFNKKEELEQKKTNTLLIVGLVVLGLVITAAIIFKVFFADKGYDEFDEFDDDFDDMDYDDDYDDFDDFDDDEDESFEEE